MKQITEDYVSYEIAKLLKEKGFDEICSYEWGIPDVDKGYVLQKWTITNGQIKNSDLIDGAYTAPTQSLALKWLREVHNIHIEIYRTACGYLYIVSNIPYGTDLYNPEYGGDDENSGQWTTYEKAVEAAILYVLKNLI